MDCDISVGTCLFCSGPPGLVAGAILPPGEFGRRVLTQAVLTEREVQGEGVREAFDLGPLADRAQDLVRPRRLWGAEPLIGTRVLGELVFEVVRLREFPERPSRLDCSFLWRDEARARAWHSRRTWPSGLYAVEVVECRRVFVADMGHVRFYSADGTVGAMTGQARRYWSEDGSASGNPEVLLEGAVRVVAVAEGDRVG